MDDFKKLVEEINLVYLKHNKELREVDFNLFELFSLSNSEVLHSLFIAELLNPSGKHQQGKKFLKLFIDRIGFSDFKIDYVFVNTEQFAGYIDEQYQEGGRIDIYLANNNKQAIIIENKIYAGDQFKQLIRYFQFAKENSENFKIYYLTLFGNKPTEASYIDNDLNLTNKFQCISYQKDILNWLLKCINECDNNSVKETLNQYLNTIKKLTHQTTNDKMKEEIKSILTGNSNYFDAFEQIRNITDEIRIELSKQIVQELNSKIETISTNNELNIIPEVIDDGDGFQLAFWAQDKEGNDLSKSGICQVFIESMKKVSRPQNRYQFSGSPICWINFKNFYPKKKLENADSTIICEMYNNTSKSRSEFYTKIENEINEYIKEFKTTCQI